MTTGLAKGVSYVVFALSIIAAAVLTYSAIKAANLGYLALAAIIFVFGLSLIIRYADPSRSAASNAPPFGQDATEFLGLIALIVVLIGAAGFGAELWAKLSERRNGLEQAGPEMAGGRGLKGDLIKPPPSQHKWYYDGGDCRARRDWRVGVSESRYPVMYFACR